MDFLYQNLLSTILFFIIFSAVIAFILAPLLIHLLYKLKIQRKMELDPSLQANQKRVEKTGTPIMGGLLIIITILIVTLLFNFEKRFTYVPIGVMGLSALLGGIDDLLNVFGQKRKIRSLKLTLKLIRCHHNKIYRLWLIFTVPWIIFRNTFLILSSHPTRGVLPHEKIILQLITGLITAWWIVFKLGNQWLYIWTPFNGEIYLGYWMIPVVVFTVMFFANAVNISDGLDGLSGGVLLSAFGGLAIISFLQNNAHFAILNATVIGALIAYIYFNIKPARFQMGDIGSLSMGSLFAVTALAQNRLLIIPFFGFIFIVETFSVILQIIWRHLFGKRLFKMAPLHHHLECLGWSEEKIVMRFWIINLFMMFFGLWIAIP
jgi:phospho-N-acetylmuramoyl-pentapeptide-transferase